MNTEADEFSKPEMCVAELSVPERDSVRLNLPYFVRGTYMRTQNQRQNCVKDSEKFERCRTK